MNYAVIIVCFTFLVQSTRASRIARQVIGGTEANIKNYPYQVSLRYMGKHFCGGAIIDEKHILTAAHCITKDVIPPYRGVFVHTGTSTLSDAGHSHDIFKVTINSRWTATKASSFANDIAVITLSSTINFSAKERKIELASHDVVSGGKAYITGWGRLTPDIAIPSNQLQFLEMTVLNNTDCQGHQLTPIHPNQLCAFTDVGRGSCFGDSGGPLVMKSEVIGILSWVENGKCAIGKPEVFTNVFAHKQFIEQAML